MFEALPDHARILDVGTGSGIVPRLALALAPRAFSLDAVDLVKARPPNFPQPPFQNGRIVNFHASVAAERLPFADDTVDLVTSQFGIEYADPIRAGLELRRIMKPGAMLALLVHSTSSVAVQHGIAESPHAEWLLSPSGLLQIAAEVLPYFARSSTAEGRAALASDPSALRARERFNTAAAEAETRAAEHGGAICADALTAVAQAIGFARKNAEGGTAALNAAHRQISQATLRSRELVDSALDYAGARALAEGAGVSAPRIDEAYLAGHPFGWWVTGTSSASTAA